MHQLENFFVDYRGGASTRPGTKYVLQCFKAGTSTVRLITFQASFAVGYVLELGDQYIRFYSNGAPILESAIAITGIGTGMVRPMVFTSRADGRQVANGQKVGTLHRRTRTVIWRRPLRRPLGQYSTSNRGIRS